MTLLSTARKVMNYKKLPVVIQKIYAELGALDTRISAMDSVDTGKLKVVTRDVTIAAEAASGNVTNAADINGVILGHYPKTSVDSAIESIALTAESGRITVTLNAPQAAGTPATVSVVVLQAPAA